MLVSCTIEPAPEVIKQIASETRELFLDHPEYLWFDPSEYRIPIYLWNDVEDGLVDKLTQKVSELLFDQRSFLLFGLKYVIRIGTRIDINLDFQPDKAYRRMVETLYTFFSPEKKPSFTPVITIARYKIPSKQQYSHVKNKLEKLETHVEIPVDNVYISKVTDFGQGKKTYEYISEIHLQTGK